MLMVGFDLGKRKSWIVVEDGNGKILVDRKSFLYLNGTEVHYEEGLMESGFKLRNPNIKRECGCGASFTV